MDIDHALFLFCGRRCDRIKAILKEPDGRRTDLQAADRAGTLPLA